MRTAIIACLIAATSSVAAAQEQAPQEPVMQALDTGSTVATWSYGAPTPKHKTPVVFLHGGPGMFTTSQQFTQGEVFRKSGFDTLYYDQVGGGQSLRIPASEYSTGRLVADLEALRIKKGADKIILWGNSFGANLAILYALRHPDHVAGIVLTSPGAFPGLSVSRDYGKTARGKVELTKELADAAKLIDKQGAAAEKQITQVATGKMMDDLFQSEWAGAGQCKGAASPAGLKQGGGNLFVNRIIQAELKKMPLPTSESDPVLSKIPTLIIRGECDYIPEKSALLFRTRTGGEYVTVAGAGHSLIENREVVDDAITRFANGSLSTLP